jgi:hypothetical protein
MMRPCKQCGSFDVNMVSDEDNFRCHGECGQCGNKGPVYDRLRDAKAAWDKQNPMYIDAKWRLQERQRRTWAMLAAVVVAVVAPVLIAVYW